MKIYAYVTFEKIFPNTSETCSYTRAVVPGSIVDGKPVSRHGDYYPWYCGKRDTLRAVTLGGHAARKVADLLGWN